MLHTRIPHPYLTRSRVDVTLYRKHVILRNRQTFPSCHPLANTGCAGPG